MDQQIFTDGIGRITVIGGVVRLDLVTYSPNETDAQGKPRQIFTQRVVMGAEAMTVMTGRSPIMARPKADGLMAMPIMRRSPVMAMRASRVMAVITPSPTHRSQPMLQPGIRPNTAVAAAAATN